MADFELVLRTGVMESGWQLKISTPPTHCHRCRERLKLPFFYCKESEVAFCQDCEFNYTRLCLHNYKYPKDTEHNHFNITMVNNAE